MCRGTVLTVRSFLKQVENASNRVLPTNVPDVPGLSPNCVCRYLTEKAANIPIVAVSALPARLIDINVTLVTRRFIARIKPYEKKIPSYEPF